VFSSGQGLTGHQEVTSEFEITKLDAPLDEIGLSYTPTNGSFQLLVFDKQTDVQKTTDIRIDLNGLNEDTDGQDFLDQLNAISGVTASLSPTGKLTIKSDSPAKDIAFANDTSGILAALGINTFFTGVGALDIGINATVTNDPSKFAASLDGIGGSPRNVIENLAKFQSTPLESSNGSSLNDFYQQVVGDVTQLSSVARSVAKGFKSFEQTLESQSLSITGVNLDEEAVRLISLQRTYQASARYISTLRDLLELLVNI